MPLISGKVSGLNLCTAQGKGPEQVQPGKLDCASLGTFFEISRKPDPVYQTNKQTSPVLSSTPPKQPGENNAVPSMYRRTSSWSKSEVSFIPNGSLEIWLATPNHFKVRYYNASPCTHPNNGQEKGFHKFSVIHLSPKDKLYEEKIGKNELSGFQVGEKPFCPL